MAQEYVGINLEIKSNAGEAVGSLRKQLKEAQAEVQTLADKFGATSSQAVQAARKAAELKDRIGDAKALTDAFNPDRKFQAFASSLQGVVGGFTAVQGALGLIGVESDEVQKTLLKVNSAMALSQGLNSILEARDSFKNLGTVIQATTIFQKANNAATVIAIAVQKAFGVATVGVGNAFKVLKLAIASTGIGLLVVGVGLLISKISQWTSSTEDNKAAQERLNRALEQQEALFAQQKESLSRQREIAVKRAQIAGSSADEIFNINQDFNKKDRDAAVANRNKIFADLKDFENKRLKIKQNGNVEGSEEDIETYKKATVALKAANKEISDIDFNSQKDVLDNQIRINNTARDNQKQANNTRKELAKQRQKEQEQEREEQKQAQKDAAKSIQDLENEVYLQSIKDETQRALVKLSQDKENQINEINATKATAEQKAQQLALLEKKFQQDKTKIETDAATERKEKEKKDADDAAAKLTERLNLEAQIRVAAIKDEFERKKAELLLQEEQEKADLQKKKEDGLLSEDAYQQGLLNIKSKYVDAETELKKKQAEDEKKIQEARKTAQLELVDTIGQGFGALSSLFGEGTAASKAFALGEIAINTATGFARGMSIAQQSAAGTGPAAAFAYPIFYAQQVLSVLNTINKARGILKQVKGGGTNPPVTPPTNPTGGSAPISPSLPIQATLTQLNQASINQLGSATNRAYVVESDVTNSQERIRRINRAARLN